MTNIPSTARPGKACLLITPARTGGHSDPSNQGWGQIKSSMAGNGSASGSRPFLRAIRIFRQPARPTNPFFDTMPELEGDSDPAMVVRFRFPGWI
jgi:hypothetical protein